MDDRILINAGPSERGWHRLATFLMCPQLYAYWYVLKLHMGSRMPLVRGSLVHVGCAHFYAQMRAVQRKEDPGRYYNPLDAIELASRADEFGALGPELMPLAQQIMVEYMRQHMTDSNYYKVVAVEEQVRAMLKDRYLFTQRWDLLLEDRAGKLILADHKCLPRGTPVRTARGPQPVESLVGGAQILSWNEQAHSVNLSVGRSSFAGVQRVFELRLGNGLSGKFGYRHPLLTRRGWVEAQRITPDDWVAVAVNAQAREDLGVADELFVLAGMLLSDGCLANRPGAFWPKKDVNIERQFVALLDATGSTYRVVHTGSRAPYVTLPAGSAALRALLDLGMTRAKSPDKCVPESLKCGSRRQIGKLLGGFWMGDGAIYEVRRSKTDSRTSVRIVYGSRSKQLCRDIQELLANMGLAATFTASSVEYGGERRPYYFVAVVGKQSRLTFLGMVADGTIWAPHLTLKAEYLKKVLLALGPDVCKRYELSGDMYWSPVVSNVYVADENCWDVTVEDNHTLIANGIVTHNCVSEPGPSVAIGHSLSGQFLGAAAIAQVKFGSKFDGIILNQIGARAPHTTHRSFLPPVPAAVAQFSARMVDAEERIEALAGRDPWDYPKAFNEQACLRRYGPCEGMQLCSWGKS